MNDEDISARKWIRATWGGWVLGVPCVIVLALAGEAIGIGGVQWLVGAGMGAGVGIAQARVLRHVLPRPSLWFGASCVGLALPFALTDAGHLVGPGPTYALTWCVASGGLLVGGAQGWLLRTVARRSGLWVVASLAGWSVAAGAAAAADAEFRSHRLVGLPGALVYLGLIACGGLALGLFTAPLVVRFRRPVAAAT